MCNSWRNASSPFAHFVLSHDNETYLGDRLGADPFPIQPRIVQPMTPSPPPVSPLLLTSGTHDRPDTLCVVPSRSVGRLPRSLRLSSGSDCKWSRSAMVFSMKKNKKIEKNEINIKTWNKWSAAVSCCQLLSHRWQLRGKCVQKRKILLLSHMINCVG